MVSKKEAKMADFRPSKLRDTTFQTGPDEGESIPANQPAEIANVKVGGDGTALEDVVSAMAGAPLDSELATRQGKAGAVLQGDADGDGAVEQQVDDVEIALGARRPNSRGGPNLTEWISHGDLNDDNGKGVWPLAPRKPIVREGRVITLIARLRGDPANDSFAVSLSDSTINLPFLEGT